MKTFSRSDPNDLQRARGAMTPFGAEICDDYKN